MRKELSSNTQLMESLHNVENALMALSARGMEATSVSLLNGRPVIRIARHGSCEQMVALGQASYVSVGTNTAGQFRQGYFIQNGCRVIWSESLH